MAIEHVYIRVNYYCKLTLRHIALPGGETMTLIKCWTIKKQQKVEREGKYYEQHTHTSTKWTHLVIWFNIKLSCAGDKIARVMVKNGER